MEKDKVIPFDNTYIQALKESVGIKQGKKASDYTLKAQILSSPTIKKNMMTLSVNAEKISAAEIDIFKKTFESRINSNLIKKSIESLEQGTIILVRPLMRNKELISVSPQIISWYFPKRVQQFVNCYRLSRTLPIYKQNSQIIKGYLLVGQVLKDLRHEEFYRRLMNTTTKASLCIIFSEMVTNILVQDSAIGTNDGDSLALAKYGFQKWYIRNTMVEKVENQNEEMFERLNDEMLNNVYEADRKSRMKSSLDMEALDFHWSKIMTLSSSWLTANGYDEANLNPYDLPFIVFYALITKFIRERIKQGDFNEFSWVSKAKEATNFMQSWVRNYGDINVLSLEDCKNLLICVMLSMEKTNIIPNKAFSRILENSKTELKNLIKIYQSVY